MSEEEGHIANATKTVTGAVKGSFGGVGRGVRKLTNNKEFRRKATKVGIRAGIGAATGSGLLGTGGAIAGSAVPGVGTASVGGTAALVGAIGGAAIAAGPDAVDLAFDAVDILTEKEGTADRIAEGINEAQDAASQVKALSRGEIQQAKEKAMGRAARKVVKETVGNAATKAGQQAVQRKQDRDTHVAAARSVDHSLKNNEPLKFPPVPSGPPVQAPPPLPPKP